MNKIEELEDDKLQVKNDPSLTEEEKDKALRKIRREIRKFRDSSVEKDVSVLVETVKPTEKKPKRPTRRGRTRASIREVLNEPLVLYQLTQYTDHLVAEGLSPVYRKVAEKPGYAFMIGKTGSTTVPQQLLEKFQARWGKKPTWFELVDVRLGTLIILGDLPDFS